MTRTIVAAALCTLLAACGGSNDVSTCTSTSTTGPCTGSFNCGDETVAVTCDSQLQICVVMGGQATCQTIAGTGSSCPSEADAASLAGCVSPQVSMCSGDSMTGITVTCM